jgi:hypothetical protein
MEIHTCTQAVTVDPSFYLDWVNCASVHRNGARFDGHVVERGIEDRPGDRSSVSRVGQSLATRQRRPSTGRADNHYLADIASDRRRQAEVGQYLEAPRADDVPTGLVAWEP